MPEEIKEPMVAIIDYGMGNLFSIKQACEYVGLKTAVVSDREGLLKAKAAILPGVGAFGDAMDNLRHLNLIEPICDFIGRGKPFLGICLGLQLLMTESEEYGRHKGLNIFKGAVIKFPAVDEKGKMRKVPQVGWNKIFPSKAKNLDHWDKSLLKGTLPGECMYFVHSYFVVPESETDILAISSYEGIEYCAGLFRENIFACQFHPEKSGYAGLKIYYNFKKIIEKEELKNG